MPELAEVVFHASKWAKCEGQAFSLQHVSSTARCCRDFDAALGAHLLSDAVLEATRTHGKRMLFSFKGGAHLEAHLGMTGGLRVETEGEFGKHDHLILLGSHCSLVFHDSRQFGQLRIHQSNGLPEWWSALPPEPHNKQFTRKRFDAICEHRRRSVLKPLLLRQEHFPGVGNWMADEILWQARILPHRRVESLLEKERTILYRKLRYVCRKAVQMIGSEDRDPPASWLFQHRWRDGHLCPKTKKPLCREAIGGRTTCWSSAWQR